MEHFVRSWTSVSSDGTVTEYVAVDAHGTVLVTDCAIDKAVHELTDVMT